MELLVAKSKPQSNEGKTTVCELYVNAEGDVEPIFVLRGSERAAVKTLIAFIDACRAIGHPDFVELEAKEALQAFQKWQAHNGGCINPVRTEIVASKK